MLMHMGLPGVSGHFGGLDNARVFVIWTMLMFLSVFKNDYSVIVLISYSLRKDDVDVL